MAAIEARLLDIELGGRFERHVARRIANDRTRRALLRLRRMTRFARQLYLSLLVVSLGVLWLASRGL